MPHGAFGGSPELQTATVARSCSDSLCLHGCPGMPYRTWVRSDTAEGRTMPCTRRTASRVYKWKINSPSPVTAAVIRLKSQRMTDPRAVNEAWKFSIGGSLALTAAASVLFSASLRSGLAGFSIALASVACSWFFLSRTNSRSLLPINAKPMTPIELFTSIAICGILYGLALPPVMSAPRGRLPVQAPPATQPTNGG